MATELTEPKVDPGVLAMREELNRLRGRLFGLVESWGLPERQENACKQLVRSITYDSQAKLERILREP